MGTPASAAQPVPGVPRLPARLVRRSRLFELLDVGVRGPLTLVAAQAGAGKTVLLSSWVAAGGLPGPVAWLTLEAGDRDPGRFWSRVLSALRQVGAVPAKVPEAPRSDLPSIDDAFHHLMATGLKRLDAPVVLVLDDFYVIATPGVLDMTQKPLRPII